MGGIGLILLIEIVSLNLIQLFWIHTRKLILFSSKNEAMIEFCSHFRSGVDIESVFKIESENIKANLLLTFALHWQVIFDVGGFYLCYLSAISIFEASSLLMIDLQDHDELRKSITN